jgi:hypothetical protein
VSFQIALLALVALGASATAAQITASPSSIVPADPASTVTATILNQLEVSGISAYDYLAIASPNFVTATPDGRAKIPDNTILLSIPLMVSFFAIFIWRRWALRPTHRAPPSKRRKRILRKMADI